MTTMYLYVDLFLYKYFFKKNNSLQHKKLAIVKILLLRFKTIGGRGSKKDGVGRRFGRLWLYVLPLPISCYKKQKKRCKILHEVKKMWFLKGLIGGILLFGIVKGKLKEDSSGVEVIIGMIVIELVFAMLHI